MTSFSSDIALEQLLCDPLVRLHDLEVLMCVEFRVRHEGSRMADRVLREVDDPAAHARARSVRIRYGSPGARSGTWSVGPGCSPPPTLAKSA
jgi:hypothetical protein